MNAKTQTQAMMLMFNKNHDLHKLTRKNRAHDIIRMQSFFGSKWDCSKIDVISIKRPRYFER